MKEIILQSNGDFDDNIATLIIQFSEIILNTNSSASFNYTSRYLNTETGYFKAMDQPICGPNIQRKVPPPQAGHHMWPMDNVNTNHVAKELNINNCVIMIGFHFVDHFNPNGKDVFMVIQAATSHNDIFVVINGKIKIENKTIIINNWCRTLTENSGNNWSIDTNKPQTKEEHFSALDLLWGHILFVIRSDFSSSIQIHCELQIHCIHLNQNKDINHHPHSGTSIINASSDSHQHVWC